MKPLILLLVCVLAGSAAGFGIAWRESGYANHFGQVTDPDLSWTSGEVSGTAPKAVVEGGPVYKFGRMDLNAVGKHTFVIRNEGDAPLKLTKEGTTCKCTLSELAKGEVPPGESVEVTLEWHPQAYAEEFAQTATLGTNDPRQPKIELRISGSVVQAVVVEPSEIRLTNLAAGETRTAAARLLSFKEPELQIEEVTVEGEQADLLAVTQRPLSESELTETTGVLAGYQIEVEVRPGLPLGTNRHKLKVKTNSESSPELEISVTSYIVGDISIIAVQKFDREKNVLYLNKLKQDEGISTKLFLIVKGPHRDKVTIEPKTSRPEYLQVKVGEGESISDGSVRKFPVQLEVPTGVPMGNYLGPDRKNLGNITLGVAGHPEIDEVNIGVYFSVE